MNRTPDRTPDFPSRQDLDDADDILFAHPPRQVTRWVCDCGEDYPCNEVRFALLIKKAAA
ncbi:hypothetical protein V6U90_06550 [Micromonospora sp. CPCC 206060]|uniref:hypothetical protein n=1 Tax=Micromonospora sp. CPCC 206060 TaxID=3122406 RepID=UPI002FEE6BC9